MRNESFDNMCREYGEQLPKCGYTDDIASRHTAKIYWLNL